MADREEQTAGARRGVPARFGICLLNLVTPGLGLLRVSRPGLWFRYVLLQIVGIAALLATFALVREMTFGIYLGAMGGLLLVMLAAYIVSIAQSWRYSAVRDPDPRLWSRWYGLVLVWALGSALTWPLPDLFKSFYRNFYIPSEAMNPTFVVGDQFIADMRRAGELRRGDVVMVHTAAGTDYIKRIAALPGDRIAMSGGVPVINGRAVGQTFVRREKMQSPNAGPAEVRILLERLPGETHAHYVIDAGYSDGDDRPEVRLGPGQYFLLGDNRDNSADSRFDQSVFGLGLVDRARITGRALFIYWRRGSGLGEVKPYVG